ncbi:MAG: Gfo/Idh/MocA family protein [Reyranellaceae bacterium]
MLNLAIAGLGIWGRTLVDALQGRSAKARFKTAVVRNPELRAEFAARHGLRLVSGLEEALVDHDIAGVVLATPHSLHVPQALAVARGHKAVFVDKPFALTRADAMSVVHACRAADVPLAVGFNRRLLPAYRELHRQVTGGGLGRVLHVDGNFSAPAGLRYDPAMWRASGEESPVGGLAGLAIHQIDMLIDLFGEVEAVAVRSERRHLSVPIDDTTTIQIAMRNGVSASLTTLTATAYRWRFCIMGSGGWSEMLGENRLLACTVGGEPTERRFEDFSTERAELEAFADQIERGTAPIVPHEQAIHGAAVFEAIVRAAKSGREERV